MKRNTLLLLTIVVAAGTAAAQERAKIRHDYIDNPTGQYSPNDPWTRSKLWRRHTGHWGRFYSCDKEEAKRCSPYICWKNADCPFVGESWRHGLRRDKARMLQRIADGSCNCGCKQAAESRSTCTACASQIATATRPKRQIRDQIAKASQSVSLLSRLQSLESEAGEAKQSGLASTTCYCEKCVAKRAGKAASQAIERTAQSPSLLDRLQSTR